MALREFWISVRTAASMMLPKVAVDSPRLDQDRIEGILRRATFWLTPGTVKGYEPEDLDFLPEDERERLDEGVREFLSVAKAVPVRGPATGDQVEAGVKSFGKVLQVIRPDRYPDYDAFVVGKRVETSLLGELPTWVREMVFETGHDSSGASALRVWVEVEDDAAREGGMHEKFMRFRDVLIDAGSQVCPDRWDNVRMRTVSEQRPAAELIKN